MSFKEYITEKKEVTKEQVTKLLIKYGNNPKDVEKMVNSEFDYAVKTYPNATASKIAEIISTVSESEKINEASPITIGEIPQKLMVAIDKVQKALGSDVKLIIDADNIHEGIHGYIIGCEAKSLYPNAIRLEKSNLAAVSKVKELRWIEIEADYVTLGM